MEEKIKISHQRRKSGASARRPVSARRRSSTFRPTHFYPKGVVERMLEDKRSNGLERLPVVVLLDLFSYLLTEDLLSLCLTSRLLYLPAAMLLYEKIAVTDDMEVLQAIRNAVRHPHRYLGTFIHVSKFGALLEVLDNNRKISDNVRNLAIMGHQNIWRAVEQKDAFSRYIQSAKLNGFLCPALEFSQSHLISLKPNLKSIERIAIPLSMTRVLHERLPNLSHVKIFYHNEHNEGIAFKSLAHTVSSFHPKLANLEFSTYQSNANSLKSLNSINMNYSEATWLCFFQELSCSNRQIEVSELSLDGYIGSKGKKIAGTINESVNLKCLTHLQLNIKESSHSHTAHFDIDTTFLSNITRFTPNLKSLACNPTFDCLFCQHSALTKSLSKNLSGGLLNLSLNYESPNVSYSVLIEDAIKSSQQRLRRLKLFDRSGELSDKRLLSKFIGQSHINTYDRASYYESTINSLLASIFYSYESNMCYSISNDFKLRLIEQEQNRLKGFIHSYLKRESGDDNRVVEFFTSFPHLKFLSIFNVDIYFTKGVPSFVTRDGYLIPQSVGS